MTYITLCSKKATSFISFQVWNGFRRQKLNLILVKTCWRTGKSEIDCLRQLSIVGIPSTSRTGRRKSRRGSYACVWTDIDHFPTRAHNPEVPATNCTRVDSGWMFGFNGDEWHEGIMIVLLAHRFRLISRRWRVRSLRQKFALIVFTVSSLKRFYKVPLALIYERKKN